MSKNSEAEEYGTWKEEILVGEQVFRADKIEKSRAERAGVDAIYALDGLPSEFEDDLVRSAQVCDVPHTWCVKECESIEEVDATTLAKGREVLREDQKRYNAHIFTYVSESSKNPGDYSFLAAGAVRNKITPNYENDEFPVVSRAVVDARHRGKGLGTVIVQHRMVACLSYFSKQPKAIHFATESAHIFSAIKHVEKILGAPFVHIGNEQYQTEVGLQVVEDYLCFLPHYRDKLLDAVDEIISAFGEQFLPFRDQLDLFMRHGVKQAQGRALKKLLSDAQLCADAASNTPSTLRLAIELIDEMLSVREVIGAQDIDEQAVK